MFNTLSLTLCLTLALQATALLSIPRDLDRLSRRNTSDAPYSLPVDAANSTERASEIQVKRDTFLYGPSIAANVSFWPTGSLGNSTTQTDLAELIASGSDARTAVAADQGAVVAAITANGGIKTLADFELLYKDQWKNSIPEGIDAGILTNYTDDLLFSMQRLSVNPYTTRRLNPDESLPFEVDSTIASAISGTTVQLLLESGSLFYADHRYQATLVAQTGKYAAACDAYFYIHPTTGDFLPLAIRTNVGSDLIYTPADLESDWLLAKIMFNMNDFWQSQWYHFSATHFVVEIVYEAAYRTLSDDHPVLAILQRLTPQLFSYRQSALLNLLEPGGFIDQLFPFGAAGAAKHSSDLYNSGEAGNFESNYLYTNLKARGLINSTVGPELKHFPYFEDGSVIHDSIQAFVTSFVDSYYADASAYEEDTELQAWLAESVPAQILDFPSKMIRDTLIDILTHIAFLGSAEHQTLNTNDISEASGTLPISPMSIYAPPPAAKGVVDVVPFLPNATQAITQIVLTALFARPTFIDSSVALVQMFNDPAMLARMNTATTEAAALFQSQMLAQSDIVSSRTFDDEGLCQGMPFIWKALDPQRAPYYLTI